jgi:hypothetical protein
VAIAIQARKNIVMQMKAMFGDGQMVEVGNVLSQGLSKSDLSRIDKVGTFVEWWWIFNPHL